MSSNANDYGVKMQKRRGNLYDCHRCDARLHRREMEDHVVGQHLQEDELPFRCKECGAVFLRKVLAVNHKVKLHKNTDFSEVFEGTKQELAIEALATSLDIDGTISHYAGQAPAAAAAPRIEPHLSVITPTEEAVVADLSECLMRGGPRMHQLLQDVQALAKSGRLAGAVADHLQKGAAETPFLHQQPEKTPAELEEELARELAVSETEEEEEPRLKRRRTDTQPPAVAAVGSCHDEAGPSPAPVNAQFQEKFDDPTTTAADSGHQEAPTAATPPATSRPRSCSSSPSSSPASSSSSSSSSSSPSSPTAASPAHSPHHENEAVQLMKGVQAALGEQAPTGNCTQVPAGLVGTVVRETVGALTSSVRLGMKPTDHGEMAKICHQLAITNSQLGVISAKLGEATSALTDRAAPTQEDLVLELTGQVKSIATMLPKFMATGDRLATAVTTLSSQLEGVKVGLDAMVQSMSTQISLVIDRTNDQAAAFRRVHDIYTGFVEDSRRRGATTRVVQNYLGLGFDPDVAAAKVADTTTSKGPSSKAATSSRGTTSLTGRTQETASGQAITKDRTEETSSRQTSGATATGKTSSAGQSQESASGRADTGTSSKQTTMCNFPTSQTQKKPSSKDRTEETSSKQTCRATATGNTSSAVRLQETASGRASTGTSSQQTTSGKTSTGQLQKKPSSKATTGASSGQATGSTSSAMGRPHKKSSDQTATGGWSVSSTSSSARSASGGRSSLNHAGSSRAVSGGAAGSASSGSSGRSGSASGSSGHRSGDRRDDRHGSRDGHHRRH